MNKNTKKIYRLITFNVLKLEFWLLYLLYVIKNKPQDAKSGKDCIRQRYPHPTLYHYHQKQKNIFKRFVEC